MTINNEDINGVVSSFRPLIRGFFFYDFKEINVSKDVEVVSVPSFGDSFFIIGRGKREEKADKCVSVPSFGDSFFILSL